MDNLKLLRIFVKKMLDTEEFTEDEARAAGDLYLAKLEAKQAKLDGVEVAPVGTTKAQLDVHNIERDSRGLEPMVLSAEDAKREKDQRPSRVLTPKQVEQIDINRAFEGKDPLTPDELAELQLQRAPKQRLEEPVPNRQKMSEKAARIKWAQQELEAAHPHKNRGDYDE